MPIKPSRAPILIVLAGPNGAGKSTITPHVVIGPKLDADYIARLLVPDDPEGAKGQRAAAMEVLRLLDQYKAEGRSYTWETTLSSNHSIKEIKTAVAAGYDVRLHFVALDSPKNSINRVRTRVSEGGHHIPTETLNRRFEIIMENLLIAAPLVKEFRLIDNHQDRFQTVLHTRNGEVLSIERSDSARIDKAITDTSIAIKRASEIPG